MNYLVINGSPHKGNTWEIVSKLTDAIGQIDQSASVHEIHLIEENIPFCDGCSECFRKGGNKCSHYGQIKRIIEMIDNSDGIIISTTAFTSKETGLLRNFFNHLEYLIHRPSFFDKQAVVVVSTSGIGAKPAMKSVSGFLNLIGFNKCFGLPVKTLSWNCFSINETVKLRCVKVAERFYDSLERKKRYSPSMRMIFWYNLFRGTAVSLKKGSRYPTEDGVFWLHEDRKKRTYERNIPVPIHKRLLGSIFYSVAKINGKHMTITYK
jgi:multimeric flavodoxin WrbA